MVVDNHTRRTSMAMAGVMAGLTVVVVEKQELVVAGNAR
jgi:hypothetical protein